MKYTYDATLVSVHDSDTFRMQVDCGFSIHFLSPAETLPQSFRVYGYDGPELGRADQLGEQARDAVIAWFAENPGPYEIHTIRDRGDKYGRFLVEYVRSTNMSELVRAMVTAGWLKPYTGSGPKPTWP